MSSSARVSLGDVAAGILDGSLPLGEGPILARRKGPERKIAEAKAEEREQAAVSRAKRALAEQPHQPLRKTGLVTTKPTTDLVLETSLRKIATRGVVQLFNAVRTSQKTDDDDGLSKKDAKRARRDERATAREEGSASQSGGVTADLSRDSFLDILRRGTGGPPAGRARGAAPGSSSEDASGASFLRDDFMLGKSRAKDWEREEEEEAGYVDEAARGADEDDE